MPERADFTPSLSPRFVTYIRDYLRDRNISPEEIFVNCGIALAHGQENDAAIPVEQISRLFECAALATENPSMGLTMGKDFHFESSSLLIVSVMSAPSVREGLSFLAAYDRYIDSGITTRFHVDEQEAHFTANLLHENAHQMAQINEYLLSFLMQMLSTATRCPVPVKSVSFCHAVSPDLAALETFFGTRVTLGAPENTLTFLAEYLDIPFQTSNRVLFKVLTNALKSLFSIGSDRNGFIDMVCRQMMIGSDNNISAEKIAERLNMSPRTLRRRLADEGYSFQEAKSLARERRAKYLLANSSASLTEIAYELGYSELSAFSRAFRAWVGETPQAYRDSIRDLLGS